MRDRVGTGRGRLPPAGSAAPGTGKRPAGPGALLGSGRSEPEKMDLFASPAILLYKKELDAAALRQRVIANNIANVNTPRFKKSTVVFESLLKEALGREPAGLLVSQPGHLGAAPPLAEVTPAVQKVETTFMRTDGNNVDIDEEMVNLAANGLLYQAAARQLGDRYSLLSYVITGGGK